MRFGEEEDDGDDSDASESPESTWLSKIECSQNCVQGGQRMHYSSDEDEAEESQEAQFYHHAKNLQHNRAYDGSRCFCKPCPQCYGVWIPADCLRGATCNVCKPPWQNNTSDVSAFLARNARAHWRLVRWCVRVRPWALHWLSAYTERRYAPTELDMAHELASATAGGVWNLPRPHIV
jgi:hypothetical protein